jgi:hypothetical protein
LLVIFLISAVSLFGEGEENQSFNICETGDLVFRSGWWVKGHIGIYWEWEESSIRNPANPVFQMIVEAPGKTVGTGVWEQTLSYFQSKGTWWGAGTINPTCEQRDAIIEFVRAQYGLPYDFKGGYKGPNSYRCDGLAEAAYENVGLDIVPDNHWWDLSPIKQMNSMGRARGIRPLLDVISPEEGERVESELQIHFKADDKAIGSGITLIEIYLDNIWERTFSEYYMGEEEVNYTRNIESLEDGAHKLMIECYDRAGNLIREEIEFYKGDYPFVVSTDPAKDATEVPIDKDPITITFSKPMNKNITAVATQVPFPCSKSWSGDDKVLEIIPKENLIYCEDYTIKVFGRAKSKDGVQLDGNEDGEPGGDYEFKFTAESPELNMHIIPEAMNVAEGTSIRPIVITSGGSLKSNVKCNISFGFSGGWSVFNIDNAPFPLSPGGTHTNAFTIRNNGSSPSTSVSSQVTAKCATKFSEGYYWSEEGHQHDHPDENQSPGKMEYPTPWLTRTRPSPAQTQKLRGESPPPEGLPEIGILLSGWADGYGHILGKYGIETLPVKPDLKILNNPDVDISDAVKLLVIGSAGLKGFSSPTFKQNLEDYVVNGGNLLVFTQKYGSDLSVLPGNIDGYGWNEDQACYYRAAYLSQWHPIFAGQSQHVMTCNVDGYLFEYPKNAEILLERTKNATPALLYYNYGAGTVIVSSLYSDWGYGHRQSSGAELDLIRDLTTWAVNPDMEIPEFYSDSSVSVPVSIEYTANDTLTATSAIIKIYTPDRDLHGSLSVPITLNPGEETEWVWSSSSIPENLGLWVIDYALLDENGEFIQGYNRGAIFAQKVDVPVGDYNLGDFQMWATSDKEEIIKGNTVNFEVFVKNNKDLLFTGKLMIGVHEERDEGGISWKVIDSIPNVTIPSDSMVMVVCPVTLDLSTSTLFGLYKENRSYYSKYFKNALVRCQKGVWVIPNPFPISLSKNKYQYILGVDTIHYTVESSNELSDSCSTFIEIYTVMDSVRYDLWSDTVELAGKEKKEFNKVFFPADYDTTIGREKLCCDLFYKDSLQGFVSTNFALTYPAIQCSLAVPDSFQYGGSNPYSVTLRSEENYIPSGELLIEGINFSDSAIVNNSSTPETTFVFNYNPDVWEVKEKVSSNKLRVQYRYGAKTLKMQEKLPFRLPQISAFRPEYSVLEDGFMPGDTAIFKAQLTLTGSLYGVPMEFCLWSDYLGSDTLRDTIILNPCSHRTIILKTYTDLDIPADTAISYNYRVNYLNKEYRNKEELQYFVYSPEAVLHWPINDTFSMGETIEIKYTNSIKVPSVVDIQSISLSGNDVEKSFTAPGQVEVPAEDSYTFHVTVPQWKKGKYYLGIQSEMVEGKGANLDVYRGGCPLYIDGIEADIEVSSDRDYYGYGDDIPFSSLLKNGKYGWNGKETLSVYETENKIEEVSLLDISNEIDTFGLIPDGNGGLVLDSVYSLRCLTYEGGGGVPVLNNQPKLRGYSGFYYSFAIDEWDNLWISYNSVGIIEKVNFIFMEFLKEFSIPDSVGDIEGILTKKGIIYLIASDSGRIYKMNSTSDEIMGYIEPPNRRFLDLRGVAVKEDENILAVEEGTKTLWEFSSFGDSVSTFVLPSELNYGDMEYHEGTVYISTPKKIITIEGTAIDSFGFDDLYDEWDNYRTISIDNNGKIAAIVESEGSYILLFSPEGELESGTWVSYPEDITFYKEDIISCEVRWEKYIDFNVYREFGKEKGMLKFSSLSEPPWDFLFHSYESFHTLNSGSIAYRAPGPLWTPYNEDLLPLSSLYGARELPPICINMEGNWQDSPVFNDCILNIKAMELIEPPVIENVSDLDLSPSDNVSFADTVKDTIPAGEYCVFGKTNSEYPQPIISDWELFTVIENNVTFLFKTDKEEGFAGDTFRINPIVINPLPLKQDSVYFEVGRVSGDTFDIFYVDTVVSLEAGDLDSFPFIIVPEEPLTVEGFLHILPSYNVRKEFSPIIRGNGLLSVNVTAPEVADLSPFIVRSEVYNYSFNTLSVEMKRIFLSDTLSDSVNIESENIHTFVDTFVTEEPGTLKVVATANNNAFAKEKFIDFGMDGVVQLDSLYEVSPDSVEMNGIVSNGGLYPLSANALFCLMEEKAGLSDPGLQFSASQLTNQPITQSTASLSAKRKVLSSVGRVGRDMNLSAFIKSLTRAGIDTSFSAIYLPPGRTDTIPIMFNRYDTGSYELQAFLFTDSNSFMFDSTSSKVNVVGDNKVFIDSLFVSEKCDTNGAVIFTAVLDNKSFSAFQGTFTISSPVCYFDSVAYLPMRTKDTLEFKLTDPVDEGKYTFTWVISEGGVPISEKSQELEFHPMYRFDSLPSLLSVSTPDSGTIKIPVSNIGNAKGKRNVGVNLADIININEEAIIEPASMDTFIDNFHIPEDLPGGVYFADASILKNSYPEIDTFFRVKVKGLIVEMGDSLDKFVYNPDDTAKLSILVENQSLWSGILLSSLQYGEFERDTSFILGGMEKGVLNETFPRDTIYLDTAGVYMFDPVNSENYDSVSINWDASLSDSLVFQIRTNSLIGKGSWITIEKGSSYVLDDWMQLKFANESSGVQWVNSICLGFKPSSFTKLDTFPEQKEIVIFDVPVDSSEEKLGWGVYYPSGRSLVLDERYIRFSDSLLTLFTGKSRYEIFDTVYATLCKNFPDTNYSFEYRVYFSPTEEVKDTFDLDEDTTNFSFVIPEWTRSGTYSIDYLVNETGLPSDGGKLTASLSGLRHKADDSKLTGLELTADRSQLKASLPNSQKINRSTDSPRESMPIAKQWVMGKPSLSAFSDSSYISGEYLFDVRGITVYFKNAKMDTNLYYSGDTAKIWTEISSDIDLSTDLTISSTGSAVNNVNLDLKKDIPNKFKFKYPINGCKRGMNELYLHLSKDSVSLAGFVLYFDVYVSDTTPPAISILEEPSNTYSSNRAYQVRARIYDPDTNGTPFHDTLYYRIASGGGSSWHSLLPHSVRGDTHKYLIPSQSNGTHIEYALIARDEFGNTGRYPEEGSNDFWILSPLKPTWDELIYSTDTSAILNWNPPKELIYYHCGLCSDTVDIKEKMVATRFTTQCLPARLKTIGLEFVNGNETPLADTIMVSVYTVAEDSLPGTKVDSFEFTGALSGYTEFDLQDIQLTESGIFIGIKGSGGLNVLLDGFGEGNHTAIDSVGFWDLKTPGELLIDGIVSHLPALKTRGSSKILSFDVFKSTEPSIWTEIASGLTSTTYTDESIQENQEYSYKIMASFGNPLDSFFSISRKVFVDLTPPEMDTIVVNDLGESDLLIWTILTDISGVAWDSLGYKNEDRINLISEDSCKDNKYFFSLNFLGDTLEYFLKVKDSSLIGNCARYPENGFYKWGSSAGIFEGLIPDSTYLFRMLNVLADKNIEIKYALSEESDVRIMFFDVLGRRARTLVDETQKTGYYSVPIKSTALPRGVYFLRMEAGDYRRTVKLVKLR